MLKKIPERIRRYWTFGRAYGWKRNLYRLGVVLLQSISGGICQLAIAEILTAPVARLRRLERLPKALQVRLATESDLPQVRRFVAYPARATQRLASGDSCVVTLCGAQVLATEWFKIGPAAYHEDAENLGVVFHVPQRTCWLYDGVSGEDRQTLGPWGAVMGRLRAYLEERDIETVYFQVGYENFYSLACHEALGFRVIGRLCCMRLGRRRFILYKTSSRAWTWIRGRRFDFIQLSKETRYDRSPSSRAGDIRGDGTDDASKSDHKRFVHFLTSCRVVAVRPERSSAKSKARKPADTPPPPTETVKAYQRRVQGVAADAGDERELRFDASVPVEVIRVPTPEVAGLTAAEYEVIEERVTSRLAQRPGAYGILKYIRPVIKRKATGTLSCPPAPPAVFERSFADVSLLAGLLLDKFRSHLPLYRQHQRLAAAGIRLSRATLTQWVHRTAALLAPLYHARLSSIRQSKVLAMDETPITAGHRVKGKLHTGYFWPLYGDQDEGAFPFAASRAQAVVREVLGSFCGVLLTDGYTVYERYAQRVNGLVHAPCWSHARRQFVDAAQVEPALVAQALEFIGTLYQHDAQARERQFADDTLRTFRAEYAKPVVDAFFTWMDRTLREQILLPTNPFTKAARYALEREAALRVFLEYPTVPLDTNHLEREIRAIALGCRNWLFCWTAVGARYVGIVQSLLASGRLQGVDPYGYLVDVLQRIDTHPAFDVHLLTPRLWKHHFADSPLRSDLDCVR
jgi:transposase